MAAGIVAKEAFGLKAGQIQLEELIAPFESPGICFPEAPGSRQDLLASVRSADERTAYFIRRSAV